MNREQYTDLKPISLKSEKEFIAEVDKFSNDTVDNNIDWKKRLNALKRMESLILGGACNLDSFPSLMYKIHINLGIQLNDLRSTLSREACRLICLIAESGGEAMELFSERLVNKESLIKLISNGNKVLAEQGHLCMLSLIENVRSPKIIQRVVEEFNSKNPFVRARISQYITKILQVYPENVIEKHATHFENAILSGISDATQETRAQTRKSYKLFSEICPTRAEKLYSRFDGSVHKMLNEQANDFNETNAPDEISVTAVHALYIPKGELPRETSLFVPEGVSNYEESLFAEEKKVSKEDRLISTSKKSKKLTHDKEVSDNEDLNKSRSTATKSDSSKKQSSDNSINFLSMSTIINTKSRPQSPQKVFEPVKTDNSKVRDLLSPFKSSTRKRADDDSPTKRLWSSTNRGSTKSISDDTFDSVLKRGNLNIGDSKLVSPSPTPMKKKVAVAEPKRMKSTEKKPTEREEKPSKLVSTAEKKRDVKSPLSGKSVGNTKSKPEIEGLNSARKNSKPMTALGATSSRGTKKENVGRSQTDNMKEDDLKFLIEKTNDENWATRFNSFEKIIEFINDLKSDEKLSNTAVDECIKVHMERICDPHLKVSVICISSLGKLIPLFKPRIKLQLDFLITPVLLPSELS